MNRRGVLLLSVALAACSSEEPEALLPSPVDAGVVALPSDAGVTPDAGVPDERDAGVVDAAPVRFLVDHKLLGDSPLDNLVMNANLTSLATVGPFSNSAATRSVAFRKTPTKQGALEVGGLDTAIVFVQSRPGMLTASVWVGRAGERQADSVSVMGTSATQLQTFAELSPTGETMSFDGINWERREAVFNDEFIGNTILLFTNDVNAPMYVTGPVVTAASAAFEGRVSPRAPALSARTRATVRSLLAKVYERAMNDFARGRSVLPERFRPRADPRRTR